MTSPPRLAPLPPEQWSDTARAMLRGRVQLADRYLADHPDAPPMPNVLGILGHHAELAGAWLSYNAVLLEQPALDPRHRELVILRIAWRTRSAYEWAQHARLAKGYGVDDEQIDAVAAGPDDPLWNPVDRLVLAAADDLLARHRLGDDVWAGLTRHFDTRQVIELLFVAGSYLCLALVFNSVDLPPDPGMERAAILPDREDPQ